MNILSASLVFLSAMMFAISGSQAGEPNAQSIINDARKECASFENGVLKTSESTIQLVDLTGNGRQEEIVDTSQFQCSTAASLFCGTGGCSLIALVEGKSFDFLAQSWRIVHWNNHPILLLAVHGANCGGTNLTGCFNALIWSENAFQSVAPRQQ